jgi:hypothetical protein
MKLFSALGLAFLLLLGFSSCQKNENYPDYPVITYKDFIVFNQDSAYIQVNFTDGNGDIGYPASDTSAPPNFWVEYMYLDSATNNFLPMTATVGTKTDTIFGPYYIPNITPTGKNKELSGEIQVKLETEGQPTWYSPLPIYYKATNAIEFRVWLVDRAGNKSNVVTTPAYTIAPL